MASSSIIWRLNFKERPAHLVPRRCQQRIGVGLAAVHSADSWNAVIQGSVVLMLMGRHPSPSSFFLSCMVWWGKLWTIQKNLSLALSLTVAWVWKVSWPKWTSYFMSVKCSSWIRGLWKPRVSLILFGMLPWRASPFWAECFISSLVFVFPALGPPHPSDSRRTDTRALDSRSSQVKGSKHLLLG